MEIVSFFWCTCWSSSVYAYNIGTLIGYPLVNVFDWDSLFIWVFSWLICWSFSWYPPLTDNIGGTDGEFSSLNISARDFNVFCVHFLFWLVGLLVLHYVVNKLNPVWDELLHQWRKSLGCSIFWEIYCLWYFFHSYFGDVLLMAYVVFSWWYYVPSRLSMWYSWCFISWHIFNY